MGEMTIRELAKITGVAVSTVSRAMNDRSDVSPETRERVREAARRYGYVPNSSARRLKIGSTQTISVIVQGELGQLVIEIVSQLERAFDASGYDVTLQHVSEQHAHAATIERIVREGKYGGVVFLGRYGSADRELSAQLIRRLTEINVPMVFCTTPDYSGVDSLHSSVSVDDQAGAHDLTTHLIGRGHRRIAFIGAGDERDREHAWALRLSGYRAALEDAGIAYDPRLVVRSALEEQVYTIVNGYESTRRWLVDCPSDVTAGLAVCDAAALGAARALSESGRRIPDDCSLVGFDGLDLAKFYVPRITTVAQPISEIAQSTARVLLATMNDPGRAIEQVWIRGRLLEGESVRTLA